MGEAQSLTHTQNSSLVITYYMQKMKFYFCMAFPTLNHKYMLQIFDRTDKYFPWKAETLGFQCMFIWIGCW